MAWRLAKSLETLRSQINAAWPNRSKVSDGTIGDDQHKGTPSDHNPNAAGVVTAFDITHDPEHGCDVDKVFANIVKSKDTRVKYLIRNSRILRSYPKPGIPPWTWAPYTGSNPHDKHGHISVSALAAQYDSTKPWLIKAAPKPPAKPKHTPPWELLHGTKVLAHGRLSSPLFLRKVKAALVQHGEVRLREKR